MILYPEHTFRNISFGHNTKLRPFNKCEKQLYVWNFLFNDTKCVHFDSLILKIRVSILAVLSIFAPKSQLWRGVSISKIIGPMQQIF